MKMTLDEAIVHAKELYESQSVCEDCREEHKQLAEWLEELKQYKNKECEISAREMFESLGYEQTINDDCFIFYEKVEAERFHTRIVFGFKTRSFSASCWINGHYAGEGHFVELDEFKAIEQQMKELRWI